MLCLPKEYDTTEKRRYLSWDFRQRKSLLFQRSNEVAYRIAKCKKLHTIAEERIKPCTEKMVKTMIESGAKKKIQQVLLSNDTIRRRIDDMPVNVFQQVCFEIKQSTLQANNQLNESTDSILESQVIAFARYEKDKGRVLV